MNDPTLIPKGFFIGSGIMAIGDTCKTKKKKEKQKGSHNISPK